ncbi:LytTR family transcriptional regulator [Paenibacillus lycopersici]|uniref:LytTR family transcriptional regulator n=1 Tax=Paenibacillus lycopersici TaxID=2704462 RepID=A0A6C0G756_9BACL|nr:LytTR family transcriptional regulator DNA-binding domain-containing protein [Paenibacillus lycopersici]QHT62965.1 LytTR family transcriptional regulator [Paenibacillus lycopersici]
MPITVYGVKIEPVNGEVVCRDIDILNEVLYMGVTPKGSKRYKPGIPMFVTRDGTYLQLDNMEKYQQMLLPYGFDLLHPSCLVNVNLIDCIQLSINGNIALFKGGGDISVSVSRSKTAEYRHLIASGSLNPLKGF